MASERQGGGQESPTAQALVERARRVLQHEQRTGHADAAVKPGGLEAFVARWTSDMREGRRDGVISAAVPSGSPIEEAVSRLLQGYHALDPMQRTAKVRAALAVLDTTPARAVAERPQASAQPRTPAPTTMQTHRPAPQFGAMPGRRPQANAPEEPWPLAKPLPEPPMLLGRQATNEPPAPRPAPRPEDEYLLGQPITAIPGVGATQAARLHKLGILSVKDLLTYYPREHLDYSTLQKIGTLPFGEVSTVMGLIWEVQNTRTGKGRTRTIARINDETGSIRCTWFNQPYLLKQLTRGSYIVVTGVKQRFSNSRRVWRAQPRAARPGRPRQHRAARAGLPADGGALAEGAAAFHQVGGGSLRAVPAGAFAWRAARSRGAAGAARGRGADALPRQ